MTALHELKFIPSVQTVDEKRIYFYAISHVPVDAKITPADDVTLIPEEHRNLHVTNPPSPTHHNTPRVTRYSTNYPHPPPHSPIDAKASRGGVNPATAEALMNWKTVRFFSELFRVMVEGVGAEADPVAYAHMRLQQDERDERDEQDERNEKKMMKKKKNKRRGTGVAECARNLPLAMVRQAVDDFLLRRREVVRRRALVGVEGGMCETRRGSESGMLEAEKSVRQWDSAVFYRRMDQYLELENIRALLLGEMAKA